MKSLIMKDLYNIGHNAKSMLLMIVFFAVVFSYSGDSKNIIIISGLLCSMMVITTFSFDEMSKWPKYAMIMPVSKKELVAGKFILLFIFATIGVIAGLVLSTAGGLILNKLSLDSIEKILPLLLYAGIGLVISLIISSISIPLLFKYGAEKARIFMLLSFMIPFGICFGVYQLLQFLGVTITDHMIFLLLCSSPFIAIVWNYVMYRISCAIFQKKELLY